MEVFEEFIDDKETTQVEAQELLTTVSHQVFEDDLNAMALALGRPSEEMPDYFSGNTPIDEDLLMKVRNIAEERGVEMG